MPWEKIRNQTILDDLKPDSPLLKACQEPQLMFVPHQDHGVRRLWKRIADNKRK